MSYRFNQIEQITQIKKESFKSDSTQIILNNPNINTLVIDNFFDECMIDFSLSKDIILDDITKCILMSDDSCESILITNEIECISDSNKINNIICKVYRTVQAGVSVEAYILDGVSEYPVSLMNSITMNYLNIDNLKKFRFKLKINKSENVKSPVIETISLFFYDTSIN